MPWITFPFSPRYGYDPILHLGIKIESFFSQLKSNANSIHKNLALVAFLAELVFAVAVNRPDIGEVSKWSIFQLNLFLTS